MSNAAEPSARPGRSVVLGLGNEDRGDDGAGPFAVRSLRPRLPAGVEALEAPGDVAGLLDAWDGVDRAFVIDAMRSDRAPGTIVRWQAGEGGPLPSFSSTSTHGLSLAEAVGLAEALGRRPRALVLFGIEAGRMDPGDRLTPEVERAVHEVAERILGELRAPPPALSPGRDSHA